MGELEFVNLILSLGPVPPMVLLVAAFVVLFGLIAILISSRRRVSVSQALAVFGIAIFVCAAALEDRGLSLYHETRMLLGDLGATRLERDFTRFHRMIYSFRPLSVAGSLIGAIGLVLPRGSFIENKPR